MRAHISEYRKSRGRDLGMSPRIGALHAGQLSKFGGGGACFHSGSFGLRWIDAKVRREALTC